MNLMLKELRNARLGVIYVFPEHSLCICLGFRGHNIECMVHYHPRKNVSSQQTHRHVPDDLTQEEVFFLGGQKMAENWYATDN